MTMPYHKVIALTPAAAVATGIAQNQQPGAGGNFNLNGSLASGGVATLDSNGNARRVLMTFAADESANTFVITGTGWNGQTQSETLAGTNTTATSVKDYKTVTKITATVGAAGNISAGTNGVMSSQPYVCDAQVSRADYAVGLSVGGTINVTIEESYNDYAPNWDLNSATPTWFPDANFTSKAANTNGVLNGPFTMLRLTVNSYTTGGSATARIITPMGTGPF